MYRYKISAIVALFVLVVAYLPGMPVFWVTLLNFIGLASLVAIGLVVLTGVGGMTSFGQAAFVGFSAYTTAVLTTGYGFSPWVTLPISLAVTGFAALLIGLITVRLSGHYLPLGTIAWAVALVALFGNLKSLGGFNGISGVPPISVAGAELLGPKQVWPLVWISVVLAVVATQNLLNSHVGRAMRALRSGSVAAEAFGIRVSRVKLIIFVYAAILAGLSGWLFAHIQRGVTPSAFGLNAGIEYLLMVVIGGAGQIYGAILGATVVVVLKDQLQDVLPVLFGQGGNYETIVFGALLVLVLHYAQNGLWPLLRRKVEATVFPQNPAGPELQRLPETYGDGGLVATGLVKKFGGLTAVNNVDLFVNRGEIVVLLGPNGAGKSTTFNLLTGVLDRTEGKVMLEGQPIAGLHPGDIAARGVSRTFQHVKLTPDMSVLENVALGAHLRAHAGVARGIFARDKDEETRIFAEADRALEQVGMSHERDQLAENLSLGSSRVVEIARALCLSPRYLLLDEPAAGLRKAEKDQLAALLTGLRDDGIGILLVEHDMEFVMSIADRIVVLDFGTLIASGTPDEIRNDPKVQEAYLGGAA